MNDFKQYRYEIKDSLMMVNYKFYYYDLFGQQIDLYSLNLNKSNSL